MNVSLTEQGIWKTYMSEVNENLLADPYIKMSEWVDHGLSNATVTTDGYKNTYTLIKGMSGYESFYCSTPISLEPGTYTFSCQYKTYSDFTTYAGDFGLRLSTVVPTGNETSSTIATLAFSTLANELTRISTTFTISAATSVYIGINGGHIADGLENKKFDVNNIKLEKGPNFTPFYNPIGANLIDHTDTYQDWAKASIATTSITTENGEMTFSNTTSTTLQYGRAVQWIDDGLWATVNNKTVTISFDIYSDDWDAVHEVDGANSGFAGFAVQICRSTAAPKSGSAQQQQYIFMRLNNNTLWIIPTLENGKWLHFVSKPFTINESTLTGSSSAKSGNYIHVGWQLRMVGVVKVRHCKVEYGEIATPWTLNPHDPSYITDSHGFFEGYNAKIWEGSIGGEEFIEL